MWVLFHSDSRSLSMWVVFNNLTRDMGSSVHRRTSSVLCSWAACCYLSELVVALGTAVSFMSRNEKDVWIVLCSVLLETTGKSCLCCFTPLFARSFTPLFVRSLVGGNFLPKETQVPFLECLKNSFNCCNFTK